jgi:serine/threonine protein kinase
VDELSKSQVFTLVDGVLSISSADLGEVTLVAPASAALARLSIKASDLIDQKYLILSLLGEGGMGAVYKARHLALDKVVALKTFKSHSLSEEEHRRFQREAMALAKLTHKNVIEVFDFGFHEHKLPYYTMECLVGQSLSQKLERDGPLSLSEALPVFAQVCRGLALVHSKGIVHRDLKPSNIFLEEDKESGSNVKLVDFGIASLVGLPDNQKVTTAGKIFGSPLYMSPEQSLGGQVGAASDVYSLGCTFFEVLTGVPPFHGDSALETVIMHQSKKAPSMVQRVGRSFPPALEALVAAMLSKNADDRPADLEEVAADLLLMGKQKRSSPQDSSSSSSSSSSLGRGRSESVASAGKERGLQSETASSQLRLPRSQVLLMALAALAMCSAAMFFLWPKTPAPEKIVKKGVFDPKISRIKDANGKEWITVNFPEDWSIGKIAFDREQDYVPARGSMTWAYPGALCFKPEEDFVSQPANFKPFKEMSLVTLNLTGLVPYLVNRKILSEFSKISTIRDIDAYPNAFDDKDIDDLNALPQLETLIIGAGDISGDGLARLSRLRQLNTLMAAQCEKIKPALKVLSGSPQMQILDLSDCVLDDADYDFLSNLPALRRLMIAKTDTTDSQLAKLSALPKLVRLEDTNSQITTASLPVLKKMHDRGVQMKISSYNFSRADVASMQKALPSAQFEPTEARTFFNTAPKLTN